MTTRPANSGLRSVSRARSADAARVAVATRPASPEGPRGARQACAGARWRCSACAGGPRGSPALAGSQRVQERGEGAARGDRLGVPPQLCLQAPALALQLRSPGPAGLRLPAEQLDARRPRLGHRRDPVPDAFDPRGVEALHRGGGGRGSVAAQLVAADAMRRAHVVAAPVSPSSFPASIPISSSQGGPWSRRGRRTRPRPVPPPDCRPQAPFPSP
jgi:hypothetical protein